MNVKLQQGKLYQTPKGDLCRYLCDSASVSGKGWFRVYTDLQGGCSFEDKIIPKSDILPLPPTELGTIGYDLETGIWYMVEDTQTKQHFPLYWDGALFTDCTVNGASDGNVTRIGDGKIKPLYPLGEVK